MAGVRYLRDLRVADDMLIIPNDGWAPTAGAAIAPDGLHLFLDPLDVVLAWEPKQWSFGWWVVDRAGGHGLAVDVSGAAAEVTVDLRERCTNLWRSLHRLTSDAERPISSIPIDASATAWTRASELALLNALGRLLAERPGTRDRMREPGCLDRLLADMRDDARHRHRSGGVDGGIRPKTVDIETELRAIDLRHPLDGRPVPGDPVPDRDDVIEQVVARVARHPFAAQMKVTRHDVARIVDHDYFDVDPWPFGALTLDWP
jgi:hypothetical protein